MNHCTINSSLNPTNRKTVTKMVCVDSLFRTNIETDSTNFAFQLAEPINNVVSMKLTSVELPNNWYTFSAKNLTNCFTVNCYNVPADISGTIIHGTPYNKSHYVEIPEGNYLSDSFHIAVSKYFANIGNGLQYIGINVNDYNSKVEFFAGLPGALIYPFDPYRCVDISGEWQPANTDFYFELDFMIPSKPLQPLYRTIGWAMGYRKNFYKVEYSLTNVFIRMIDKAQFYTTFVTSESSFGSTFQHYIFLEVDDFQRNVSSNTIVSYIGNGDSYLNNDILAKIPITSGQYTNIIDNAADYIFKTRNYYGPIKLEKLHIKLLNRFGEVLDLNRNDFSFALELEVVYQ